MGNRATQETFLRAQFVIFSCQRLCKKEYIEMTKKIYLETFKKCSGLPCFPLLSCFYLITNVNWLYLKWIISWCYTSSIFWNNFSCSIHIIIATTMINRKSLKKVDHDNASNTEQNLSSDDEVYWTIRHTGEKLFTDEY